MTFGSLFTGIGGFDRIPLDLDTFASYHSVVFDNPEFVNADQAEVSKPVAIGAQDDTMTHGELFAGISGFGLGFSKAGIKTLWHVEIDIKCQAVLKHHYPTTLLLSDVRDCGTHNLPSVDIISLGSPCQDLSIAGKREGLIDGEKSNLFFEAIRIVGELKPTFAVWENVPGAFSSNSGRDFAAVLTAFQNIGARDIAWTCLDAQYFGVAQRRRRVFLIADFRGERAAQVLFESEGSAWDPPPSREAGQKPAFTLAASVRKTGDGHGQGWNSNYVVADPVTASPYADNEAQHRKLIVGALHSGTPGRDASDAVNGHIIAMPLAHHGPRYNGAEETLIAFDYCIQGSERTYIHRREGYAQLQASRPDAIASSQGVRRLTPTEAERLQGFPDGWTANGQSDTARYKQLGNAVCVTVAEWLGKRLIKTLRP